MGTSETGSTDGVPVAAAEPDGESELTVDVGILVSHAPDGDPDDLSQFGTRLAAESRGHRLDLATPGWPP